MQHEGHHRSFTVGFGAAISISWIALAGCGGDGGSGNSRRPVVAEPEPPPPVPSVSILSISVTESGETGADALFPVTLTPAPASPVTVGWHTEDIVGC